MLTILLSVPAYQFITITSQPPSTIATYSAQRNNEAFILANYNLIPKNCTVITFKPPLWYVFNRSDIYTTWVNIPQYANNLSIISRGCMYFDYDVDCYIGNSTGTEYLNTESECHALMNNYTVQEIASQNYEKYSWNATWYLYRIIGRKIPQ